MGELKWQDSFSIGDSTVDSQHKKFIDILNNLIDAVSDDTEDDFLYDSIIDLKTYAHFHFFTEEKLMLEHDYEDYFMHKKTHENFLKKVKEFEREFKVYHRINRKELLSIATTWFVAHVVHTDSALKEVLIHQ